MSYGTMYKGFKAGFSITPCANATFNLDSQTVRHDTSQTGNNPSFTYNTPGVGGSYTKGDNTRDRGYH